MFFEALNNSKTYSLTIYDCLLEMKNLLENTDFIIVSTIGLEMFSQYETRIVYWLNFEKANETAEEMIHQEEVYQ